ncbi:LrgB family protein [Bacillus sp. V3B]|uniref:LrgB family protein n=1 Tax=Bacillus sp. V3B TaxID=2804915 RepID=UPI002810C4CB|nr:LrgB family protein [Bacillus sp. V3B]MCQ6276886.1 LrgB family protein [Bacillus sp. V3B]
MCYARNIGWLHFSRAVSQNGTSKITGPLFLKIGRIKGRIVKGLSLGTSAQIVGANRAFEWGELEVAMGSIAMITSALFMSIIIPLLFNL